MIAIARAISLAVVAAALAGHSRDIPTCFPRTEIARAKVVRVERNGVLVLQDGRTAELAGILLPDGAADRAPDSPAKQAVARLNELASGRTAILAAVAPGEDRYGRLRAQILIPDAAGWLQNALLREGLARVDLAPDRSECATELYAAESRARADRVGIWSLGAYAVRTPAQAAEGAGTFQIVQGAVLRVSQSGGRVMLEFGRELRKDFAVTISPRDMKTFRAIGVDPFSYRNQTVRVRGWIGTFRRPEMAVATPAAIEIVEAAADGPARK